MNANTVDLFGQPGHKPHHRAPEKNSGCNSCQRACQPEQHALSQEEAANLRSRHPQRPQNADLGAPLRNADRKGIEDDE